MVLPKQATSSAIACKPTKRYQQCNSAPPPFFFLFFFIRKKTIQHKGFVCLFLKRAANYAFNANVLHNCLKNILKWNVLRATTFQLGPLNQILFIITCSTTSCIQDLKSSLLERRHMRVKKVSFCAMYTQRIQ